jgi:hypothetical protein
MLRICSEYVKKHCGDTGGPGSYVQKVNNVRAFVTGHIKEVVDSYPLYSWDDPVPQQGVFRIQELRPDFFFQRMGEQDPEYSIVGMGGSTLLVVGNNESTNHPMELWVVEGKALKFYGHTQPGERSEFNFPSFPDLEALILSKNKSEFIFSKDGATIYHQPNPAFIARTHSQGRNLSAQELWEDYITSYLGLDRQKLEENPTEYYKRFCRDVFGAKEISKENGKRIKKAISPIVDIEVTGEIVQVDGLHSIRQALHSARVHLVPDLHTTTDGIRHFIEGLKHKAERKQNSDPGDQIDRG